jgi:cytochrome oxidase Cu insertion factor (SCO1/SenC/PrrC family)
MPHKLVTVLISGLLLVGGVHTASAQNKLDGTSAQTINLLRIQGRDVKGEALNADSLKGKVAVVFYWSTDCAVCMNSLSELRANANGWRDKPFTLLTVNVNRHAHDWLSYEKILSRVQVQSPNIISVRQNDDKPPPSKLPLILLVDTQGQVVARYEGRLAPEVWDAVADLIP